MKNKKNENIIIQEAPNCKYENITKVFYKEKELLEKPSRLNRFNIISLSLELRKQRIKHKKTKNKGVKYENRSM